MAYHSSAMTLKKLDKEATDLSNHTLIDGLKTCDKNHNKVSICCSNQDTLLYLLGFIQQYESRIGRAYVAGVAPVVGTSSLTKKVTNVVVIYWAFVSPIGTLVVNIAEGAVSLAT